MDIGIYKIGILIDDVDLSTDKNGRFEEMVALYEIFMSRKHDIQILDETCMIMHEFDIIYVLNGTIGDNTLKEMQYLRSRADKLVFILTDLRLITSEISELFDMVLTQTYKKIDFIHANQGYNGMPELALYCSREIREKAYNTHGRNNLFIFGGGIRDRADDIYDYVIQNKFAFYGKGKNYDNRLPIKQYHEKLLDSRYSILLADKEYNEYGFITWRYFENMAHGIITFIDSKCDKYNALKLDETTKCFLNVKNSREMKGKMIYLEEDSTFRNYLLQKQKMMITEEKLDGTYTYNKLMFYRGKSVC